VFFAQTVGQQSYEYFEILKTKIREIYAKDDGGCGDGRHR
jgi:hypothetical protein